MSRLAWQHAVEEADRTRISPAEMALKSPISYVMKEVPLPLISLTLHRSEQSPSHISVESIALTMMPSTKTLAYLFF